MTDRELDQRLLGALENSRPEHVGFAQTHSELKAALSDRLARQEQEPALFYSPKSCDLITERHQDGATNKVICATARTAEFSEPLYTAPPPVQQEPTIRYDGLYEFAAKHRIDYNELCRTVREAIAPPPAREWQGLTVAERVDLMPNGIPAFYDGYLLTYSSAIEAKLKERNA